MSPGDALLSVEEARAVILAAVAPLGAEQRFLDEALGCALAEEVVATRTLPPWDNSAMDGYAVRAAEVEPERALPVYGTVAAGAHGSGEAAAALPVGAALRIMTGAPVPDGADAVIMREEAVEEGPIEARTVRFRARPAPGAHIRRAGEDLRAGQPVLALGARLDPGEIGVLAAQGRTLVRVHRAPRVAIISTGDELVPPDRAPGPGQIVGSNAWALAAQCRAAGAQPRILPFAPDDRAALGAAFAEALADDVVISSGGVSVGDFDFVKEALEDLGVQERFWKVAMKPGKPLRFGVGRGRPVFGLPGNPASSMVAFELFVRPALLRLAGHAVVDRPRCPVVLDGPAMQEKGRRHFVRARLRRDGATLRATPLSAQGSGQLRSLLGVHALLDVPDGGGHYAPGASLDAILLDAV